MDGADVGERALIPCPHVTVSACSVLVLVVDLVVVVESSISNSSRISSHVTVLACSLRALLIIVVLVVEE